MATQVWAPYTTSNGQWIASKILQGFLGAPIESLCEISVTDVYFQHERGFYIALYALLLAGSKFVAPLIAGFIADGQGWQWVLYWCAIFCGAGFVFLFFLMEETNYSRAVILGREENGSTGASTPQEAVKDSETKAAPSPDAFEDTNPYIEAPTTKSYLQKLKLFRTADMKKPSKIGGMVLRPLIFLSFPVIFYAGFSYGSNLVWFNVLNGTSSLILGGPPYNFRASMVGLSYISPLIGTAIASAWTGYIGDRIVLMLARKNRGILESEHRLWLFLPSLLWV